MVILVVNYRINLNDNEYYKCKNFAEESAKTQREYRSGGTQFRSLRTIEQDTLRGKVGEFIAKKFLEQEPFNIKGIELDFEVYERGKWDEQDFSLYGKKISIKSVKWFSKWLLLETKDIQRGDIYDYYILVAVDEDYKSGTIKGFVSKEEIINDSKTLKLKKGEFIPRTRTTLDADNHARHYEYLHNSLQEWNNLISLCSK